MFLIFCPVLGSAVVMRHDVAAEHYQVEKVPEYIVDMPYEGHGVLIDPKWILTVAHTVFYDYEGKMIRIGNQEYQISRVVLHPAYRSLDWSLLRGDSKPLIEFFMARSDIALIKLSSKVNGIDTIRLYDEFDEMGRSVMAYGHGAMSNGLTGADNETKSLKIMNRFQNIIEAVDNRWLHYVFDRDSKVLPLEGMSGSGDSGGPAVIYKNGKNFLAGLNSWQSRVGNIEDFVAGLYGATNYLVRISRYKQWIDHVIASHNEGEDDFPIAKLVDDKSKGGPPTISLLRQSLELKGYHLAGRIALELMKNEQLIFFERDINRWGYELISQGKKRQALEVFKLNVQLYPGSPNTYDSLAEAYITLDNVQAAIENYERVIKLNPNEKLNPHVNIAKKQLKKLRSESKK